VLQISDGSAQKQALALIELQLRYDQYNRLTNEPALERDFKTWTLGAQYFLSPNTRLSLNYAIRSLDVPHAGAITNAVQRNNAEAIASSMGNRIDLQLTAVF
jgi:phosphate-selective porin